MKKISILIILLTFLISACSVEQESEIIVKNRPVVVEKLKSEKYLAGNSYSALVVPQKTVRKAFAKSGMLAKNFVVVGEKVEVGDYLLSINQIQDEFSLADYKDDLATVKEELEQAKAEQSKMRQSYISEKYNAIKGDSNNKKVELAWQDWQSANTEYNKAQNNYNNMVMGIIINYSGIDPMDVIFADLDGYVLKVLNRQGEMVGGGYPTIVLASAEKVLEIGITSEDVKQIKIGDLLTVNNQETAITAVVTEIEQFPDKNTGTYTLKADLGDNDNFEYGEMLDLSFQLEEKEGIFVDINHILNDGVPYVYVVENSRAVRKNIEVLTIKQSRALVSGLKSGEQMITRGYNSLADGYQVEVKANKSEGE